MKRRKEREFVLKVLYAVEFNPDPWQSIVERLDAEDQKLKTKFASKLIEYCLEHRPELDHEIISKLKNWDFKRLAVIDKIILRMAIAEMLYFEEIPPEVSINEAIELGKIYSTERSGRFINGLLDAIFRKLKRENRIHKTGRGLVSKITR